MLYFLLEEELDYGAYFYHFGQNYFKATSSMPMHYMYGDGASIFIIEGFFST